jgi:hypothetical protein
MANDKDKETKKDKRAREKRAMTAGNRVVVAGPHHRCRVNHGRDGKLYCKCGKQVS